MIDGARLHVFSVVSAIAYTLAYYFNWPLFHVELDSGQVGWLRAHQAVASISWYGWLATAALTGVLAAALIPPSLARRLPPDAAWWTALLVVAATLIYEKRWFV